MHRPRRFPQGVYVQIQSFDNIFFSSSFLLSHQIIYRVEMGEEVTTIIPKIKQSRPPSAHFNSFAVGPMMALSRLLAASFVIFSRRGGGVQTSIPKNTYSFLIILGGPNPPSPRLIPACNIGLLFSRQSISLSPSQPCGCG